MKILIPKVLHQIWISDEQVPQKFVKLINQNALVLKGFQMRLWTKEDLALETFPSLNGKSLTETDLWIYSRSNSQKADLARYLILHKYGGYYSDLDFQYFSDLPWDHNYFDLCIASESLWYTNSFIGCSVGNVFLEEINLSLWSNNIVPPTWSRL